MIILARPHSTAAGADGPTEKRVQHAYLDHALPPFPDVTPARLREGPGLA